MNIDEMTTEQLKQTAKSLKLEFSPNSGDQLLRDKIEVALMQKRVIAEEEVREKLRLEYRIKTDMAEIKEMALAAKITLTYPEKPTIVDVVRLKKRLGIEIKKPKPSPETLGIEASKKFYYKFTNHEQPRVDVTLDLGGKYMFHLWPGKKHVLPEYAVKFWEATCKTPSYKQAVVDGVEQSVRDPANEEDRFIFQRLGDAPDDAKFGVCM